LFPILETVVQNDVVESLLIDPLSTPVAEKPDVEGWEVLPSSTYAGRTLLHETCTLMHLLYYYRKNYFTCNLKLQIGSWSKIQWYVDTFNQFEYKFNYL